MKLWHIQSGHLRCFARGNSAEEALVQAIESENPQSLGVIASAQEEGTGPVFAVLLHTETILRKYNLWSGKRNLVSA